MQSIPRAEIDHRVVVNLIAFLGDHLRTKGTRHAEDQNTHDAILTALVDAQMAEDKLITAVARLLGVRWEAVKRAVLRRVKLDEEEKDVDEQQPDGSVWTRVARSTRCDKYELPGLYAFCHDETFFRFSSRRSEPLREHIGMRKYKVHRSNPIHSHTRSPYRAHPNIACAACPLLS